MIPAHLQTNEVLVSASSEHVKKWRENVKIKAVKQFGGKCQNCGYNRCYQALDFHHINPEKKDFHFGQVIANPVAWVTLEKELKKCVLVCANCHAEIHEGSLKISKGKIIKEHKFNQFPNFIKQYSNITKEKISRVLFKLLAISGFGNKCGICSYNRSINSLQFHHLDPSKKEFKISSMFNKSQKNWGLIEEELTKCILLCSCCHREVHSFLTIVSKKIPLFNSNNVNFALIKEFENKCPICDNPKLINQITCEKSCASSKPKRNINWNSINFKKLIQNKSISQIADSFGVSSACINKRVKNLGLR